MTSLNITQKLNLRAAATATILTHPCLVVLHHPREVSDKFREESHLAPIHSSIRVQHSIANTHSDHLEYCLLDTCLGQLTRKPLPAAFLNYNTGNFSCLSKDDTYLLLSLCDDHKNALCSMLNVDK